MSVYSYPSFSFSVCLFSCHALSLSRSFMLCLVKKKCRLSFPLRNAKLAPQLFLCWTRQVQHRRLNVSEWRHPLISLLGVRKFPSMPCHPLLPAGVGQFFCRSFAQLMGFLLAFLLMMRDEPSLYALQPAWTSCSLPESRSKIGFVIWFCFCSHKGRRLIKDAEICSPSSSRRRTR